MKILLTGMNKNQCTRKFYLRQQLKVIPSHYSLYNCLVDMGHDVEHRVVEIGEDLSQYDEVIVFIAGPRQLVTTTLFNGLWAISQRPDAILAFDDWQVPELYKGVEKCKDPKELTCDFILNVNKTSADDVAPYLDKYIAAIEQIASKKNRMLISAFQATHLNDADNYGAHLLFDKIDYPKDRLFVYNPNPYHRNRKPNDYEHEGAEDPHFIPPMFSYDAESTPMKDRRFNFASLVQSKTKKWLKKQGFVPSKTDDEAGMIRVWEVDMYGSKADSQKRLTEDEMCKVFATDWGCLMPGYDHAGSGWWRARPLQVADAGAILIGERKELEVYYGKDFPFLDLTAKDLTVMSDDELKHVADAQREALYKIHPLDKNVQQQEIKSALEASK